MVRVVLALALISSGGTSATSDVEDCELALQKSANTGATLESESFYMEVRSTRTVPPAMTPIEVSDYLAQTVVTTIEDHAASSRLNELIIERAAGVIWEMGATHEMQKVLSVTYSDGLWRIVDVEDRERHTVDIPLLLKEPLVFERLSAGHRTATVRHADAVEIIQLDTSPRQIRVFDKDWVQRAVLNTYLFGTFMPNEITPHIENCRRDNVGDVHVSLREPMVRQLDLTLSHEHAYAISRMQSHRHDGSVVTIERSQFRRDHIPALATITTYPTEVAHLKVRPSSIHTFELQSFEYIHHAPRMVVEWRTGDRVREERTSPPISYTYQSDLPISDSDRELIRLATLQLQSGAVDTPPSCGTVCLAVIAKLRGADPQSALGEGLTLEENGTLSLRDLVTACSKLGIPAEHVQLNLGKLDAVPTPSIVHVSGQDGVGHFVCVLEVHDDVVKVFDPLARSVITLQQRDEFERRLSGYAVVLE